MTHNNLLDRLVLITAVVLGVLRFTLPVSGLNPADIFKDVAHVVIGVVLGLAIASRDRWYWIIFGSLCVLEVVAAIVR